MNLVVLSGNVVKDARLFSSVEGRVCCVSRIAVREDRKPREKEPTFIDFVIWGNRAERLSNFITKGKSVSITGRIEVNKNIKEERTYLNPRIVVDALEFINRKDKIEDNCNNSGTCKNLDTVSENS
ncbi:MAG: single-stranded DNA-binding protein [Elusimicrobiota bacterium]